MFLEILIAVGVGILCGIFTGLTPGVHINLISILLVSVSGYFLGFTQPITLACFIIAMSVTHTFLDSIPSIFLGAPDSDQVLNVLPGHKLLLRGMGFEAVKLTVVGSLMCLVITIAIIPLLVPIAASVYLFLKPYIGWILLAVVLFMIFKEKGKSRILWSLTLFWISGILGIIVLNMPNLKQPLLPMLSGLFGISTLLTSLSNNVQVPKQRVTEMIEVNNVHMVKAFGAGTFSGCLTGLFPGLGAAQAAIIASQLTGNIGMYSYMILVGGINTVNFVFSLVTFYTLEKARNGAVLAVLEIVKTIDIYDLVALLCVTLVTGGIATFLALGIARGFAKVITILNYKALCLTVISLVTILVVIFSGWLGLVVLVVSTAVGIVPNVKGIGRNHAMGCLLMPVIMFFLL